METARVRRLYDEFAGKYDRVIGFSEKLLLSGGRNGGQLDLGDPQRPAAAHVPAADGAEV